MAWVEIEAPAIRWLLYVAATTLVGVAGALWSIATIRLSRPDRLPRAEHHLLRLRQAGALLFASAIVLALIAQVRAWFGAHAELDPSQYAVVLRSAWGHGWIAAALTGGLSAVIAVWPSRGRAFATTSTIAAAGAALAVPMTGHGATAGASMWLLHVMHVAGGGLWIGSLGGVLWAVWPVWRDGPTPVLAALLARFSRIALSGAFALAASGVVLALIHVPRPLALTSSPYGQTLLVKVIVMLAIAGLGWRNWQRLGPAIADPSARRTLARAAIVEVVLGTCVALTAAAWLSNLAPPVN
jgi:putative copper export protein